MPSVIICCDFDGTIVEHEYPDIGPPSPGAFDWLKRFQQLGARLILLTMRGPDNFLQDAVDFCRENGVEFWAHNVNPEQDTWSQSRKVYGHRYIDDTAVGVPLRPSSRPGGRLVVDWDRVGPMVEAYIIAKQ